MKFLKKYFHFLIISLLLLFYTIYRSEITYSGRKDIITMYYIYISVNFIIGTFYINQKIKEYLIIIV